MRDDLLLYYERELTFLREMGAEFAQKYPKIASRLVLEADKCEDPHVERMLEGFAFLAARVHLKIDDEFPEITEALLNILYPHYMRPVPSMSIVEFQVDSEQVNPDTGLKIDRDSVLNSRSVGGAPCKFRTCFDTTFWPVGVANAEWTTADRLRPPIKAADAVAAIRLELKCAGDVKFSKLAMSSLRLYLGGESNLTHTLYELLCNNCARIIVRDPSPKSKIPPVVLDCSALRATGFGETESMLPYTRRSFAGYRLLMEYFCFPQKFFFFDLGGFERLREAGFGGQAEVIILISPFERAERREMLETGITAKTFRTDCVPVVNLFRHTAEPILLDQRRYEYQIIPDVSRRNAMEVFSIEDVVSVNPGSEEVFQFEPFYSFRHAAPRDRQQAFWHAVRRSSGRRGDEGTEVFISLVDLSGRPINPDAEALTVRTICTNRDLPSRLPFGNEAGDFELEGAAPIKRIVALVKPTDTVRPPLQKHALWRLISTLSLNYLSLVEGGVEALQEILRLYNFTGSAYSEKQIQGLAAVASKRHFARLASEHGVAFARGTLVNVTFNEEQFAGGGVFLFAAVLEYFLGLYAGMNSFSQLVARSLQRKEAIRRWPPRAGHKVLM
ncbi:MAG TPA: type VI secretion system baseplate subunit TssF [Candidatus Acidoferrales bacterium]|nr:type VI secretion system baseplate subunit TssF [Candidatus Acidoferrales bacterium]